MISCPVGSVKGIINLLKNFSPSVAKTFGLQWVGGGGGGTVKSMMKVY